MKRHRIAFETRSIPVTVTRIMMRMKLTSSQLLTRMRSARCRPNFSRVFHRDKALGCESFVLWHLKKDAQVLRSICTALAAHPARPGARRSTARRGCGRCWTCVSGWGRVTPQGCPGAMASGRATWQGRREKQELVRLQRLGINHPRWRCLRHVGCNCCTRHRGTRLP